MKQPSAEFEGEIRIVALSPHGEPEGAVLVDGTFVRIPAYSVRTPEKIKEGVTIVGVGELVLENPNRIFSHAKIYVGGLLVSDDSMKQKKREALKEKHKIGLRKRGETDPLRAETSAKGRLVAIGLKAKGSVDRLILADGTSIHVPRKLEIFSDRLKLGETVEVEGDGRVFAGRRFLKAKKIVREDGAEIACD